MELSKRGQGLSTNAIILIILGVFILAILILGFTLGWNNLKDKISSSNNVGTIAAACSTACATHSQYDFCVVKRDLGLKKVNGNEINTNCSALATNYKGKNYGIKECPAITCTS